MADGARGAIPEERDPRAVAYARARALLDARGLFTDALWRVTEGMNAAAVLSQGTDRAGRPEADLAWAASGYRGRERRWSEVIFASTEEEVRRRLRGLDPERPCALDKLGEHAGAIVLCYDPALLESVHDKQFAARAGTSLRAALWLVMRAADGAALDAIHDVATEARP